MTPVSARLERRVRRDFGERADVIVALLVESPHPERVHAAAVLYAAGNSDALIDSLALADIDWRDTLMRTYGTAYDLASEGWELRLELALGPDVP